MHYRSNFALLSLNLRQSFTSQGMRLQPYHRSSNPVFQIWFPIFIWPPSMIKLILSRFTIVLQLNLRLSWNCGWHWVLPQPAQVVKFGDNWLYLSASVLHKRVFNKDLIALEDNDEIVFRISRTNCVWNRPETKPLPHNIRLSFFKICISLACFRGSRRPLWTLLGAEQILVSTKNAISPGFWSQWQIFIFLTPEKTDCPLVRLGPKALKW